MSDNLGPIVGQTPESVPAPTPVPSYPAGPGSSQEPPGGWQAALARSQLRVKSLTVATIVLAVATLIAGTLAMGFAAWGFSQSVADGPRGYASFLGEDGPGDGPNRVQLDRLFNSDGTLNSKRVQRLRDRMQSEDGPSPMAVRFALGRAVLTGDITTYQAEELAAALGLGRDETIVPPPLRPTAPASPPATAATPSPGVPRAATPSSPATPSAPTTPVVP
ncbi:MAG: hypothetical protein QG671_617 [Actinomycetota bacterium]|nr:hypothetical protein [Actinomycetota bacterium]